MLPRVATSAGRRLGSSEEAGTRSSRDAIADEDTIASLSVSIIKSAKIQGISDMTKEEKSGISRRVGDIR